MRKTKVKRLRKQFEEEVGRKPDKAIIEVRKVDRLINFKKIGEDNQMIIKSKNEFRRFKKERRNNG